MPICLHLGYPSSPLVSLKDGAGTAIQQWFTQHIVEGGGFAHTEALERAH